MALQSLTQSLSQGPIPSLNLGNTAYRGTTATATPPTPPTGASNPNQLDPNVKALALAIRQQETGGNYTKKGASGEYGAYQWLPGTWAADSKKYLGQDVPFGTATPEQQNEVAYKKIADWKNAGYGPAQIASMWNAGGGNPNNYLPGNSGINPKTGVKYDTTAYAKNVTSLYQQYAQKLQSPQTGGSPVIAPPSSPLTVSDPNTVSSDNQVVENDNTLGDTLNNSVLNPLKGFAQGIVRPFAKAGVEAYNLAAAPIAAISAPSGQKLQAAQQAADQPRNIHLGQPVGPLLNTTPTTDIGALKNAANFAGTSAEIGANFLGGEGASSLVDNAADQTLGASVYQGAKTGFQAGGLSGLGQGLQNIDTSQSLGQNALNVGKSTALGAGVGTLAGGTLGAVTGKIGTQGSAATDDTWDMVQPKGRDVDPNSIQYKKTGTGEVAVSVPTTPHDQELIQASQPYVKPNDPIGTYQNINKGIADEGSALRAGVANSKSGTFSVDNYTGLTRQVTIPLAIKDSAEMTSVNNINDYVENLADKAQKNVAGRLDVAQQFRQGINNEYGENIWGKDTPIAKYIKNLNQSLNDYAESGLPDGKLPDGTPFKAAMKKMSLLYEAQGNIQLPKVGTQTSTNLLGSGLKFGKPLLKYGMEGVGLGAISHLIP